MQIPVIGMDPSLRHWGLASATLDLETGLLSTPSLSLVVTGDEPKGKQVRMNSYDIEAAEYLHRNVSDAVKHCKAVFVEVPHGSQSASAMKGYGICIGVLGALRSQGIPLIEVSATENKKIFTGDKEATKMKMINRALELYPDSNWPTHSGKVTVSKAEHMADAIAAIHSGVHTPLFKQLMRLYAQTGSK